MNTGLEADRKERTPVSATTGAASPRPVVLHVRSIAQNGGGPEKTILNSPRFLKDAGYDAYCAFLHNTGEFAELERRGERANAKLVSVPDHGIRDWRVVSRVVRVCREIRPDIWHGHDYKSDLLGLIARRYVPMKLVTTVHGWVSRRLRPRIYAAVDRRILRYYDAVIAVSGDLYQQCLKARVDANRCLLVPNAIDLEDFRRRRTQQETQRTLGFPVHGPVIGAMGRLADEKGFDVLIRAAARLVRQGREFTILIAGEGHRHDRLQALINSLDVQQHVLLVGHLAEPKPFFEALDMFVLSSYREGLPNVVLEAMAMEVPVVATTVAGVPTLIRDGENGVLVTPGSMEQLYEGIARLLDSQDLRTRLRVQAHADLFKSYSFASRMQRVTDVYRSLLPEPTR